MYVLCALAGVECFQIDHVAHDPEPLRYTVSTMHVARSTRRVKSLAAVVSKHQTDHFRRRAALFLQASEGSNFLAKPTVIFDTDPIAEYF